MTNFAERTIWTGDNLDILRGLNSASVDLIYLDPPFNCNRNYAAPVGSAAAGAAFKDTCAVRLGRGLDGAYRRRATGHVPSTPNRRSHPRQSGLCTKVRYVAESAHFVLWLAY